MTLKQKIEILRDAAELIASGEEVYSCVAITKAWSPSIWGDFGVRYVDFYGMKVHTIWPDLGGFYDATPETQSLRILLLLNYAEALKYE